MDHTQPLVLENNAYGKPFLKDHPELHFNVAHTPGLWCMGVANVPVGVDVERLDRRLLISEKRFESRLIAADEHYDVPDAWTVGAHAASIYLWTLKESACKARGVGTAVFKDCCVQGSTFYFRDRLTLRGGFWSGVLDARFGVTVALIGEERHHFAVDQQNIDDIVSA